MMDLKKKKELLYYYIFSTSKLNMDEIDIDVDFTFVNDKLDTYMVLVKYDSYCDPDIEYVHYQIKKVSDTIYDVLTQIIYDENFNLVRQSQTDVNIQNRVMGPIFSKINYNWMDQESLFAEIQYVIESI